jgi:hypothetical protein
MTNTRRVRSFKGSKDLGRKVVHNQTQLPHGSWIEKAMIDMHISNDICFKLQNVHLHPSATRGLGR